VIGLLPNAEVYLATALVILTESIYP
jgi:hypothetical protein